MEIEASRADDREAWLEGCVEACGADENVDWVFIPVATQTAAFRDLIDFTIDDIDVWLGQRFEVANTWRKPTAAERPFGDEFLFEEFVRELCAHLIEHICSCIVLCGCVFEKKSELTIEARFDVFAVF